MADPFITPAGSIAQTTAPAPQPASAVLPADPGATSNPPVAMNPISSKPPVLLTRILQRTLHQMKARLLLAWRDSYCNPLDQVLPQV